MAHPLLTILEQMASIASVIGAASEALQVTAQPGAAQQQTVIVDVDDTHQELVIIMPGGGEWRCPVDQARLAYATLDLYVGDLPRLYSDVAVAVLVEQAARPGGAEESERHSYATLGLSPVAPREVVEAAYRALARAHHPDAGGASDRMARINAAYAAIKEERGWT